MMISKANKAEIMKRISEAGDPANYETSWDEKGIPISKKKSNVKKGRNAKAKGGRFELKVRKDLEKKGRVVDKWSNNVDLEAAPLEVPQNTECLGKIIPAKRKYNPFSRALTIGTGFPDFISIKKIHDNAYSVIGVEVKMNGTLSKIEKEKCRWYLRNEIFSEIWIAKQGEKRGSIEYVDFKERYGLQ